MVTHTRQLVAFGTRAIEMANGQVVNGKGPMNESTPKLQEDFHVS